MNRIPLKAYLTGAKRLPAGAVPLACDAPPTAICATPSGHWIRWNPKNLATDPLPPIETQAAVIRMICAEMGGTHRMAEQLEVSARTIEAWRYGKKPLPIKVAEKIANLLR